MQPTIAFKKFRDEYPPQPRNFHNHDDELLLMPEALGSSRSGKRECPCPAGVLELFFRHSSEPLDKTRVAEAKYLWVVIPDGAPAGLEADPWAETLSNGLIKHTNLTGGSPAHTGGELWFLKDRKLVINGSSGRYGPDTAKELEDAADCFRQAGYIVASMGWNFEDRCPNAVPPGGKLRFQPSEGP
jgi:hypothetical protein